VLEGLEKDARGAKKGLWADSRLMPPWGVGEKNLE
jgi:endonuclease YncB( thermonuclease family)